MSGQPSLRDQVEFDIISSPRRKSQLLRAGHIYNFKKYERIMHYMSHLYKSIAQI